MALNVRHPIWLPAAPAPGVGAFSALYFVESFARASVVTLVPIQAFELMKDEQLVSIAYSAVGVATLAFSLMIPALIAALSRRWVYTIGACCLIAAAALFAGQTLAGQLFGMAARVMGAACLSVALNLYILDFIRKKDYVRNDSARITSATAGWTFGPFLGVWLHQTYGADVAYGLSAGLALLLIIMFWYLRLSDSKAIRPARLAPAPPLRHVARFVSQPRLRLAWVIAFGRSSFWSTFFVYAPILMVTTEHGANAGGLLVSLGNAALCTAMLWGKLAGRVGIRRIAAGSFLLTAIWLVGAGLVGESAPLSAAAMLLVSALFMVPLDSVGSVPFYRAVHAYERTEMTSVYRTYMDIGELIPPLIYATLLGLFGIGVVFIALGGLLVVCGLLAWRHLPRRL